MKVRLLRSSELKTLEEKLEKYYGISSLPKDLEYFMAGEKKVKLTRREVLEIVGKLRGVVNFGLYVAKLAEDGVPLSIEGSQLLDGLIGRGVVELTREEAERWMAGAPIERQENIDQRYVVARFGRIYLGSGRVGRDQRIYPQVPKWRRVPEC